MSVNAMRNALKNQTKYRYSEKWCAKVDRMRDEQVIAVYMRMKAAGEIF
jgi:hypothetical protein